MGIQFRVGTSFSPYRLNVSCFIAILDDPPSFLTKHNTPKIKSEPFKIQFFLHRGMFVKGSNFSKVRIMKKPHGENDVPYMRFLEAYSAILTHFPCLKRRDMNTNRENWSESTPSQMPESPSGITRVKTMVTIVRIAVTLTSEAIRV